MERNEEKIIIFDWGGVIESHKDGEFNVDSAKIELINKLNPNYNKNDIAQKFDKCKSVNNIIITATNNDEQIYNWYKKIKDVFDLKVNYEKFCKEYKESYNNVYFYKDVVNFAHSLKEKCKIGILSNLCRLDKERINYQVNLEKFDMVWLSFELESSKPDLKIYNIVENTCGVTADNILFIDDKDINIEVAKTRNWNTCHAYGYELDKIKEEVNKFLNE